MDSRDSMGDRQRAEIEREKRERKRERERWLGDFRYAQRRWRKVKELGV
jgi:hypothetical protein